MGLLGVFEVEPVLLTYLYAPLLFLQEALIHCLVLTLHLLVFAKLQHYFGALLRH